MTRDDFGHGLLSSPSVGLVGMCHHSKAGTDILFSSLVMVTCLESLFMLFKELKLSLIEYLFSYHFTVFMFIVFKFLY